MWSSGSRTCGISRYMLLVPYSVSGSAPPVCSDMTTFHSVGRVARWGGVSREAQPGSTVETNTASARTPAVGRLSGCIVASSAVVTRWSIALAGTRDAASSGRLGSGAWGRHRGLLSNLTQVPAVAQAVGDGRVDHLLGSGRDGLREVGGHLVEY